MSFRRFRTEILGVRKSFLFDIVVQLNYYIPSVTNKPTVLMRHLKIGIDNGGVCSIHRASGNEQGHVADDELNMPGARASLEILRGMGHQLFLESFAGRRRALATYAVLNPLNLFEALHFTKRKEFKSSICEHFGLDVMIDDSFDVVTQVAEQNPSMLVLHFTGDPTYADVLSDQPGRSNIKQVSDWAGAVEEITKWAGSDPIHGVALQEVGRLTDKELAKMLYKIP
jgi:hypothetical protein